MFVSLIVILSRRLPLSYSSVYCCAHITFLFGLGRAFVVLFWLNISKIVSDKVYQRITLSELSRENLIGEFFHGVKEGAEVHKATSG